MTSIWHSGMTDAHDESKAVEEQPQAGPSGMASSTAPQPDAQGGGTEEPLARDEPSDTVPMVLPFPFHT